MTTKPNRGKEGIVIINMNQAIKKYMPLIIIAVLAILILILSASPATAPSKVKPSLASLSTKIAPWPPEYSHLYNRLAAIHLPLLSAEGTAQHIHSHLDILINGQKIIVPANIGIPPQGGITPVHTHDTSGIIHVETPDPHAIYSLGQFFDIWGVKLTNSSIGAYRTNKSSAMKVYSDGKLVAQPTNLALRAHEEIFIDYGPKNQTTSIPISYKFPAGY